VRIVLSNSSVKWGGVHAVTVTLAAGLLRRGHDVTVFGAADSILQDRMRSVAPFVPILGGMDLHPRVLRDAVRALRASGADVVLAMMKKDVRQTLPAASFLGIPSAVRHANDRPLRGWLYDRALFGVLPLLHIVNSNATRSTLLGSAKWIDPSKVRVIHNGIDAATIDSAIPAELGMPDGALVTGFIGRLERRKGLIDLMNAWPVVAESIPQAHLVIAGRGPDEQEARKVAGSAPRVTWLGYRDDSASVIKSLDIAVVPSHWEGFGLVAAEAMAAGIPVVAADASSLPEIVRHERDGLLVPPRNPAALAAANIRLAGNGPLRRELGKSGRDRVITEFGSERMVDEYEAALEGLVGA
jgi:glycosyltransferase involved in cell wall biosynthesis